MLHRDQAFFGRMLLLLDAAMIMAALLVAWMLRFKTGFFPIHRPLAFSTYFSVLLAAIPVFISAAAIFGLYGPLRIGRMRDLVRQIFKSDMIMGLVVIGLLYFYKQENYSRAVLGLFVVFAWGFVLFGRYLIRTILVYERWRGVNQRIILFIGMSNSTRIFINSLHQHMELGYRMLGYLNVPTEFDETSTSFTDSADLLHHDEEAVSLAETPVVIPCLGSLVELDKILGEQIVDHVVMTLQGSDSKVIRHVMSVSEMHGVHALLVPDFIEILPRRPRFDEFAGLPIIDTRYTPLDETVNMLTKRLFDMIFSLFVLIVTSPLLIVIALLVKLSSPGPIVFRQERLGKSRRRFTMYKFRTMYQDNPKREVAGWTIPNDPRRTPIGRYLRRLNLDELPQFFNVLRGDMSVIGPRPERPNYAEAFREDIPRYMIKHRVRPGITGWAQVNGLRGDTSVEERIEYDLSYIEGWTFSWDLRIIGLTLLRGFFDKNAY